MAHSEIPEAYAPGGPIPDTMGAVADLYMEIRTIRLAAEKELKPWQEREAELKKYMIDNIAKTRDGGGDTGAAGRYYRVQIVDKPVVKVTDWTALQEYIIENNRFDFLQRRVNDKVILETLDADMVGGVEEMLIPDVSVTKIKTK